MKFCNAAWRINIIIIARMMASPLLKRVPEEEEKYFQRVFIFLNMTMQIQASL